MSSSSTRLYFYTYYKISEWQWQSCSLDQCRLKFSVKCSRLSRCQSLISHICIFCIMNSDKMVWKHSFVFCKKNTKQVWFWVSSVLWAQVSCRAAPTSVQSKRRIFIWVGTIEPNSLFFFFCKLLSKVMIFSPWRLNWKWSLLNRFRLANLRPLI